MQHLGQRTYVCEKDEYLIPVLKAERYHYIINFTLDGADLEQSQRRICRSASARAWRAISWFRTNFTGLPVSACLSIYTDEDPAVFVRTISDKRHSAAQRATSKPTPGSLCEFKNDKSVPNCVVKGIKTHNQPEGPPSAFYIRLVLEINARCFDRAIHSRLRDGQHDEEATQYCSLIRYTVYRFGRKVPKTNFRGEDPSRRVLIKLNCRHGDSDSERN
jgi:hypothetical protein